MTSRRQYRVRVIRDSFVIDSRMAPAALAEQYGNVMRLLYPNDQIRCDLAAKTETPPGAIASRRIKAGQSWPQTGGSKAKSVR